MSVPANMLETTPRRTERLTTMTATAPANTQEIAHAQTILNGLESYLDRFVVGQQRLRESLLIGLLSSGHLLLESVPGLAKTTAAAALANAVDGRSEERRVGKERGGGVGGAWREGTREGWRRGAALSFFFSSRRRHTRSKRDWSSDVCSSDLSARSPSPNRSTTCPVSAVVPSRASSAPTKRWVRSVLSAASFSMRRSYEPRAAG